LDSKAGQKISRRRKSKEDGKASWKVDRRRKSRVSRNAPMENTIVDESEVGSTGRAGRLIGGESRREAGRQRRRDTTDEELRFGSTGRAGRLIGGASRR